MTKKSKDQLDRSKQSKTDEYEVLKKEYDELETRYMRVVADYQNVTKRYENDRLRLIELANEDLMLKLIVTLDDMDEALKHTKCEGITEVADKLRKILAEEGLEEIDPKGELFDPSMHEAIDTADGEEGKIIIVHRKGYKLAEKVIRPAMVAVGNGE